MRSSGASSSRESPGRRRRRVADARGARARSSSPSNQCMSTGPREYPSSTSRHVTSASLEWTCRGFFRRPATSTWALNSSIWALPGDTSEYFGSSPTSPTPSAVSQRDESASSPFGVEAASEGCTPMKHLTASGLSSRSLRLGGASAAETPTETSRIPLLLAPATTSRGSGYAGRWTWASQKGRNAPETMVVRRCRGPIYPLQG